MVRVSFRTLLTPDFRQRYRQYLQQQPDDDQQIEMLEHCSPNLDPNQHFRLFQISNDHAHPCAIRNIPLVLNQIGSQFQNRARNQPNQNNQQVLEQNNRMAQQPQQQPQIIFVNDLYHGNIDPGTMEGAKLSLKATASISEEDKFDLKISTAQKFIDLMRRDSTKFGWDSLIHAISFQQ